MEPGTGNLVDRALGNHNSPLADDAAFFRRLSLDTVGVIPHPAEVASFLADPSPDKRERAIESRLADPRWADGWMGYWQDVLAENPGLLKPTLNNTGPFRRFLHDALSDNLAIDRLVTTLVQMQGSVLGGGPAGFGMASQNDAPMAAKAHVLAKAFLAAEMKCARCHDAPFHPYEQKDLFGLAALLSGRPQAIPATSTVPRQPGGRVPAVSISLKAGEAVDPAWSLTDIAPEELPEGLIPEKASPRERLAALITSPTNRRFAPVIVNRLWHRYLGYGFVEPVDDWDSMPRERHHDLLTDLARELIVHDYDMKHVARVIFQSRAYQAESGAGGAPARRMSAEQVLDSLFAAVGKPFRAEELCLDVDGRRPPSEFLNLGRPRLAWQLALPSNERDRPALTLPVVSSLTDTLLAFGWRAARPDPITVREDVRHTAPACPTGQRARGRRAYRPALRRQRDHRIMLEGSAGWGFDPSRGPAGLLAARDRCGGPSARRLPGRDVPESGRPGRRAPAADASFDSPCVVVEPPASRRDDDPEGGGTSGPPGRPSDGSPGLRSFASGWKTSSGHSSTAPSSCSFPEIGRNRH